VHITIEIVVPPSYTDELIQKLKQLDEVISLTVLREGSHKPEGDVLTVHALNRGADEVMRLADAARQEGQVSVTTSELTSIVDPDKAREVRNDVDEAIWEEAETSLRHQSQTTANFLALMALGGAVGSTALVVESETQQAMAIVAASIIAPGFEPLAKISMGLGLRRWAVVGTGLKSAGVGYLALVLSAALVFLVVLLSGLVTLEDFVGNSEVESLAYPSWRDIFVSACGAVAGVIMMLSYRLYLIPGALIALEIIEATTLIGMALVAGEPELMYGGAVRLGLDVLFIVVGGMLVVLLKQALFHRRRPMV
jgi:hypothetical protein